MVEAIFYVLRTAVAWRDLPPCFGPWESVYTRWRRWCAFGLWQEILRLLSRRAEGRVRFIDGLVEHQITRDREWFAYEKQKLVLLILLFLSVWIMFFLLWEKLDEFRPDEASPAVERNSSPDPATLSGHRFDEPIAIHYVV